MSHPLSLKELHDWAHVLDEAYLRKKEVTRITSQVDELTVEQAYRIQQMGIHKRLVKGEKIIGYKMGLTSKAKMKQMGVNDPIWGVLTSSMSIDNGAEVSLSRFIHPKIEPEIAFVISKDISEPLNEAQALDVISGVCAAAEIIDSRYLNFDFKLPDVIADNCSSSGFILGPNLLKPSEISFRNLGMMLEVNGKPLHFGSSAAIYGDPLLSFIELTKMAARAGVILEKGSIVLAGAATAAVQVSAGDVIRIQVDDLGTVRVKWKA